MKSKSIDIIRVVIFTILALGMSYAISKCLPDWIMKNSLLIMTTPLFAHVITRLITKDKADTKELFLHIEIKGKLKYYIWIIIYPIISSVISSVILICTYAEEYSLSRQLNSETLPDFILMILFSVGSSFVVFHICLGEEYGWRAYLTPKLEKLMPEWIALLVSGCIWGMWHAPLIKDIGFNFGTGYKFFPYAGYIGMIVLCTFTGAFLTWLTKRTGSIYPASVCHSIIDVIQIVPYLLPEKVLEKSYSGQSGFNFCCLFMTGYSLVGLVFFVILCLDKKEKKVISQD